LIFLCPKSNCEICGRRGHSKQICYDPAYYYNRTFLCGCNPAEVKKLRSAEKGKYGEHCCICKKSTPLYDMVNIENNRVRCGLCNLRKRRHTSSGLPESKRVKSPELETPNWTSQNSLVPMYVENPDSWNQEPESWADIVEKEIQGEQSTPTPIINITMEQLEKNSMEELIEWQVIEEPTKPTGKIQREMFNDGKFPELTLKIFEYLKIDGIDENHHPIKYLPSQQMDVLYKTTRWFRQVIQNPDKLRVDQLISDLQSTKYLWYRSEQYIYYCKSCDNLSHYEDQHTQQIRKSKNWFLKHQTRGGAHTNYEANILCKYNPGEGTIADDRYNDARILEITHEQLRVMIRYNLKSLADLIEFKNNNYQSRRRFEKSPQKSNITCVVNCENRSCRNYGRKEFTPCRYMPILRQHEQCQDVNYRQSQAIESLQESNTQLEAMVMELKQQLSQLEQRPINLQSHIAQITQNWEEQELYYQNQIVGSNIAYQYMYDAKQEMCEQREKAINEKNEYIEFLESELARKTQENTQLGLDLKEYENLFAVYCSFNESSSIDFTINNDVPLEL
jgi:hypothetical protein